MVVVQQVVIPASDFSTLLSWRVTAMGRELGTILPLGAMRQQFAVTYSAPVAAANIPHPISIGQGSFDGYASGISGTFNCVRVPSPANILMHPSPVR